MMINLTIDNSGIKTYEITLHAVKFRVSQQLGFLIKGASFTFFNQF